MGDITLKVEVSGEDSIIDDIKRLANMPAIKRVNTSIYEYMEAKLQEHIQTDVYEAYDPTMYPRRVDYPQYGKPMIDTKAYAHMEHIWPSSELIAAGGLEWGVSLEYLPSGSHSGKFGEFFPESYLKEKDIPPDAPIKPNPVHGDDLIRRIETASGYDWKYHGDRRPFWYNFVEELIATGFSDALQKALELEGYEVTPEAGDVQREIDDGAY